MFLSKWFGLRFIVLMLFLGVAACGNVEGTTELDETNGFEVISSTPSGNNNTEADPSGTPNLADDDVHDSIQPTEPVTLPEGSASWNPILQQIFLLSNGNYKVSDRQMGMIEAAEDPELVAERLPARVLDFRGDVSRALQVPISLITVADALAEFDYRRAVVGYSSNNPYGQIDSMKLETLFLLGQRVRAAGYDNHYYGFSKPQYIELSEVQRNHPVVKEVLRLTSGRYQFTSSQMTQIERAADPEKVADWLAERTLDFRMDIARGLDVPLRVIKPEEVIVEMDLSRAVRGYSSNNPLSRAQALDKTVIFSIGHRVGLDRN